MRIASFNVENLFSRVHAMNLESWSAGREALTEYSRLNATLQKEDYTTADKKKIVAALEELGLTRSDDSEFVLLRQCRGRLLKRPKSGGLEVVANGRADWIGWLALKTEAVNEVATRMTARVMQDVNADVLAVVEAEDRIALQRFSEQLLKPNDAAYGGIMLIDGNDARGIDVGILTKPGYTIESMISHVDDMEGDSRVFSRDCPEYLVRGPAGAAILVLVNHLKSKGYGTQAESDAKRRTQARRVREIYEQRRSQGMDRIAIVGDFNDVPDSAPLKPLLAEGSDLRDISQHTRFQSDGRPGTYQNGAASGKIDYLLLSPALFECVQAGGVWRRGVWGGKNGTLFSHYEEMTEPVHAASDHAAIWAELDL